LVDHIIENTTISHVCLVLLAYKKLSDYNKYKKKSFIKSLKSFKSINNILKNHIIFYEKICVYYSF